MHIIRWNRRDRARLGMAVARFNKIAKEHGLKTYEYSDVKEKILTRKELERRIKMFKGLRNENADTYEQEVRENDRKLAERTLKRLMKRADKGDFMVKSDYGIYEGELYNIKNLEKLSPSFKSRKMERIAELARSDYEMLIADNYRKWYIKTLDEYYSEFEGYEKLKNKLESIKNPQTFYDKIRHDENASDIYYMRYSKTTQDFFNKILSSWGLDGEGAEYEEEVLS